MKQKFDGTTGYQEQQVMKQPMGEDEIAEQASQKDYSQNCTTLQTRLNLLV